MGSGWARWDAATESPFTSGRAQDAGAVREDLVPNELITVIIGVAKAAEHAGPDARLRDHAIEILFDGLRPPGSGVRG